MALTLKSDGSVSVEEPKAATAAAGAAVDSGEKVEKTTTTTTNAVEVPEAAAAGVDIKNVQANLGATYDSKYDEQLADLYNQITQRKPFEYSTQDDMLYQEYLQRYTQQGQQAMRDTMGQAAALTGGYGSSYGQAVGQQQYDAYLQQLNALLPELQNAAYQKYAAEGDRLTQQYGLLSDMEARDRELFSLNQSINQSTYERLMNEAALKGAAGDFSGYEALFGADSAGKMEQAYNLDRLLPFLEAGLIDEEQFNQLLAPYLQSMGIVSSVASGGGSSDPWAYGGVGWNPGYMSGTTSEIDQTDALVHVANRNAGVETTYKDANGNILVSQYAR